MLLLPLENLTGKAGFEWERALSSAVLDYDLSGVPNLVVLRGESVGSIPEGQASRVLQGYVSRDRDQISVHVTLMDSPDVKTVRVMVREGSLRDGLVPLLDQIAKQIRPEARPFCTRDEAALQAYSEALQASDLKIRAGLLHTAATQDPKFSAAFIALGNTLLESGHGAEAAEVANTGVRTARDPIDKAQLAYLAALAGGDLAARERALGSLVALLPTNAGVLSQLAQTHALERKYREAITDYERLVKFEVRSGDAYNQMGYLYAYLHDAASARGSIRKYQDLSAPADPNPSDSLGEVNFLLGDFAAAERAFLDAHAKNPAGGRELRKAAQARLLSGDVEAADRLFQQFLALNKTQADLQRAQWDFLSGRRKQGIDRLREARKQLTGDEGALATAQLAVWILQTGQPSEAAALAADAKSRALSPGVQNLATLCSFLSAPVPGATPLPLFNGMAFMLGGRYAEAIPQFTRVLAQTPPAQDGEVRTWLAWCLWKAGNAGAAKTLADVYPLLFPTPESIFVSLTYPRFLGVRGAVLPDQQAQKVYERLIGGLPDRY